MTEQNRLAHAPASHPSVPARKTGVLLVNLGTPNGTDYWNMRRYLREFLSDQRVIEAPKWLWQPILHGIILTTRPKKSGEAYASIWNNERDESPLRTITRAQTEKTAERMKAKYGDAIMVDYCMRYGDPSTGSKIEELQKAGCDRIVFFPLYPQYSATTTATANDQAFRKLMKMRWQPAFRTVAAYYEHPLYAEALAKSVETAYAAMDAKPDVLVASYHGLPKEYLDKGDPYHCTCHKTTRLLRERHGYDRELRAIGQILRDQFVFMTRAGFDAFEVKKDADADAFAATMKRYSVFYQPTGDGRVTALNRRMQLRHSESASQ